MAPRTRILVVIALAFSNLVCASSYSAGHARKICKVYVYTDDLGRPVRVSNLAKVPPDKRSAMIVVDDCSLAKEVQYSYVMVHGQGEPEEGSGGNDEGTNVEEDEGRQTSRTAYARFARKLVKRRWLFFLCALVVLASWIGLLIAAWRSGLVWFLVTLVGALWFPPVVIVYIVTHWREAKVPFLAYAAAYVAALMLIFL